MATDSITISDQADGLRDRAWKALSLHPSTTTTLATALGAEAPACIDAAIAKVEHDLRPVPFGSEARGEWEKAIDERLRRLAGKVLPTAKLADTQVWRTLLVEALSDLPAMVALTAAKRAIHTPFRYIGDIEVRVREIAAEVIADRQEHLAAFKRHRAEIDRALNPTVAALPAPDDDAPFSPERIRAMNADFRRMGLKAGFLTQEQIDEALAEPELAEAA